MSDELQQEEREVLESIYDGDEQFAQINDTTFTYRVGQSGSPNSFLVEIQWGSSYPDDLPTINLDVFYNSHLNRISKTSIKEALTKEGEDLIGSPMTYSLFEFAKEKAAELIIIDDIPEEESSKAEPTESISKTKKVKKEVLSKQQKRRLADRLDAHGERPRGWNWVDIVKLSKTGTTPQ